MKKKLLIIPLVLGCLTVNAVKISYAYDASGNRIKREIVMSPNKAPKSADIAEFTDILAEKTVRISPNPTKGDLKITVSNYEISDNVSVYLFSLSGQMITQLSFTEESASIDITGQPHGLYLMKVIINGKETIWKIIKE